MARVGALGLGLSKARAKEAILNLANIELHNNYVIRHEEPT